MNSCSGKWLKICFFFRATRHFTRTPYRIRTIRINHERFVTINWHLVNDIWNQGDFPKPLLNVELRWTILKMPVIWWYFWCFAFEHQRSTLTCNYSLTFVKSPKLNNVTRLHAIGAQLLKLWLLFDVTVTAFRQWILIHLLKFKNLLRSSSAEADCSSF